MDSDLDILQNKNAQLKKQKLIVAGLIIWSLVLMSVIVFIVVTSRLQPPAERPSVKVLERHLYENKYGLKVPKEITVGELFNYQARGKKLVENNPEIRLQTVCTVGGSQVIQTIATFTSIGVGKGDFEINRSTTIPPSTKNVESDDCELQSIATYTFYTIDENGKENSFQVPETAISNKFKLIVPEVDKDTVSVSNTPVVAQEKTGSTSTSPENLNVAQSQNPPRSESGQQNDPDDDDTPNGVVPEQPETRFIRRTVNGVLGLLGL